MKTYTAELVAILVEQRKRLGFKRKKVAEFCNVLPSVMAYIERGDVDPTIAVLMDYADFVGMTLEWKLRAGREP